MHHSQLNHHPHSSINRVIVRHRAWFTVLWRYKMVLILPLFIGGLGFLLQGEFDPTTLHFNKTFLAIAILEMGLLYGVWSSRWRLLINSIVGRKAVSRLQLYFYLVTTHIVGQFVPHTASIATVGSASLNRAHNIPLSQGVTSVLFDQLFHALLVALLTLPAILTSMGLLSIQNAVILSLVSLGLMWIGIATRYQHWLKGIQTCTTWAISVGSRLPLIKKHINPEKMTHLQTLEQSEVLSKAVVLQAYSLSVIGFLAMVVRSWLIGQVIGVEIDLPIIFIGVALVQAGSLIGFTPGGLGIKEGAWIIALTPTNLASDQIALFLIAHRVIPLIALGAVWTGSYLTLLLNKRFSHQKKQ